MPVDPEQMYLWRRLTETQRSAVLEYRKAHSKPWHSPPHYESDTSSYYLITAACYEHKHIIGKNPERMSCFEQSLISTLNETAHIVFAWCLLPNHYHALIDARNIKSVLGALGKLHGRTSHDWNGEEQCRGRQVWCNAAETAMKSEGHYYATLNYVLNNAAHHGYVTKWSDWPYSNAAEYLQTVGREDALRIWKSYPLFDYGKDWDSPEL